MNKEHKWTECGLNADWIYRAWHYGTNKPNIIDGDYYVFENEDDGKYLVLRSYPSREEDTVVHVAEFLTKADALAMIERNDTQELKVSEFCAGKTPNQIVESIIELGEKNKDIASDGFCNMIATLGVESGDNFSYHTADPSWDHFIDLQGQWISHLASREIVDFIEDYKGIGDEKRIDAIQKAIWREFPTPPQS